MSHAIQLGPLLVPFALLLVFGSAVSMVGVGHLLGKKAGVDVDPAVWRVLLVGVVAARLGFVYEYRTLYLSAPLSIVDIRDGGWDPTIGLLAAWLYGIYLQRVFPVSARPLRWAMVAGTLIFAAGTAVIGLRLDTDRRLPDLSFATLDGQTMRLSQFAGRPTVVNLWATWCGPCAREMPMLRHAQDEHPDVNFVFLNQGESAVEVARWLQLQQLPLRNVGLDEKRQASAVFQQVGYPTTLFFKSDGHLSATRLGELSPATLDEKLQASRH